MRKRSNGREREEVVGVVGIRNWGGDYGCVGRVTNGISDGLIVRWNAKGCA